MRKNLLVKKINISEEYDSLIKKCIKNHIILYNYALQLLHNDNTINVSALQKSVKLYINKNNIFPIIKLPLFIEIYYLHKKFKKGVKCQKNITDIQYMTFAINDLQNNCIKINIDKKNVIDIKIADFFNYDEYEILNDTVRIINFSYSNKNNSYVLSAFN